MRKFRCLPKSLLLIAVVIAAGVSLAVAEPPTLDLAPSAVAGGLNAQQRDALKTRLVYWRDLIVQAAPDSAAKVIEGRVGILNDYGLVDSAEYQNDYVRIADEVLTPLLGGGLDPKDKLYQLKLVNVSIAFAKMSQVATRDAFTAMVQAKQPAAVRYLGWKGFHNVRLLVISQSSQDAAAMFKTLQPAAATESVPPIVGAIFEMCDIAQYPGAAIDATDLANAQKQMRQILQANWNRWCVQVLTRNIEATRAFEKGIATVKTLTPVNSTDADKTLALQMLITLLKNSAYAYDGSDEAGPIGKANATLLGKCEAAIIGISQKRLDDDAVTVTQALTDKKITDRGLKVKMAVLMWAEKLKDMGVTNPKVVSPDTLPAKTPGGDTNP